MGKRLKSYLGTNVTHPRLVILLSLVTIGLVGFVLGWSMSREGGHHRGPEETLQAGVR